MTDDAADNVAVRVQTIPGRLAVYSRTHQVDVKVTTHAATAELTADQAQVLVNALCIATGYWPDRQAVEAARRDAAVVDLRARRGGRAT